MNKLKKIFFILVLSFTNIFLSGSRFFRIKNILFRSIGIRVGDNSKIVGPIKIGTEANLTIGDECWIGRNFCVDGNGKVIIGNCCDIAPEVIVATGSHIVGSKCRRAGKGTSFTTIIEDGCGVGIRSTIVEGSTIGKSCVIGACTLVNKDVNDSLLVAGVPAKIIKKL